MLHERVNHIDSHCHTRVDCYSHLMGLRERNAAHTRALITESALSLFADKGYDQTTMAERRTVIQLDLGMVEIPDFKLMRHVRAGGRDVEIQQKIRQIIYFTCETSRPSSGSFQVASEWPSYHP